MPSSSAVMLIRYQKDIPKQKPILPVSSPQQQFLLFLNSSELVDYGTFTAVLIVILFLTV